MVVLNHTRPFWAEVRPVGSDDTGYSNAFWTAKYAKSRLVRNFRATAFSSRQVDRAGHGDVRPVQDAGIQIGVLHVRRLDNARPFLGNDSAGPVAQVMWDRPRHRRD